MNKPVSPDAPAVASKSLPLAILWMSGAVVSFLLLAIGGRELSDTMTIFQVVFFRTWAGLAIVLLLVWRTGFHTVATKRLPLHFLRNVIHLGGISLWFLGISLIPLSMVFSLEFTTPIWTTLLAAPLLGQRLSPVRLMSVFLGFVGVLIILRPGLGIIDPAAFFVLGAAVFYAVAFICNISLSKTEKPLTILFYMGIIQAAIAAIPVAWVWVPPQWDDAIWILLVGMSGVSSHYCFTRALMLADAVIVLPVDYLRLPLALVIGAVIYLEPIDPVLVLGAGVIIAGNIVNIRHEARRRRTES
jgi:drug/metabolite transporter (DMT)-like permease